MSISLKGKYICFTGKLDDFTRADLEEMAREYGFTFMSTVTRTTDILVKGDKPGKTKVDKAFRLGIREMSGQDFITLLMADEDVGLPEPKAPKVVDEKAIEARLGFYRESEDAGIF